MKLFLILILALGGLLLVIKLAGRSGGAGEMGDRQALALALRALEEKLLAQERRLSELEKSLEGLRKEPEGSGEPEEDWELMYQKGLAAIMGYSISDACGAKGEM